MTEIAPLDYDALRARGYSEREARAMLRVWGVKVIGGRRYRISPDVLARIERGELTGELTEKRS